MEATSNNRHQAMDQAVHTEVLHSKAAMVVILLLMASTNLHLNKEATDLQVDILDSSSNSSRGGN